jgi:hypothetical protein
VVIALLVAAPMLYMAVHDRIDYDGWWHVFIAREAPWARLWRDVEHNAHPPVFYLLLRAAAWFGSGRLVYRSLSIAAAIVATYVVGRIAARVFRTPALSLLCALAFGLAVPTVVMACAVRSYMLSLALVLIAFRPYLDLVAPTPARIEANTRVVFVLAIVGAIVTSYSAIFFVCAAGVLPCLYAAVDRRYRTWLIARLRTQWPQEIACIVPIVAVIVAAYAVHMSRFAAPMSHTAAFYPDQLESAAGWGRGSASFLARTVVAEIDLFSPLPIARLPGAVRAMVVLLCAALAGGLALTLRRRSDWAIASAPLATLVIMATAIVGASLLGRYPFGGFLRQQCVLFPFAVLSAFALVDEIATRIHSQRLMVAVSVAVILNAIVQWRQLHLVSAETGTQEVTRFNRFFGDARAVYVDQFSLIPFFAAHQRDEWPAQTAVGQRFFALPVIEPQGTFLVLRDMTRWSSELADPGLHRDLREVLELTHLPSIDVFWLRQDAYLLPTPPRLERVQLAESMVQAAESEHLRVERLVLDGFDVYARLQRNGGAPP